MLNIREVIRQAEHLADANFSHSSSEKAYVHRLMLETLHDCDTEIAQLKARIAKLEKGLDDILWLREPGGSPSKTEYLYEVMATKALSK